MTTSITPRPQVTVTIRVTEQDIAKGKPRDDSTCPIARAVRRVLRPAYRADIGYHELYLYRRDEPWLANTAFTHPERVERFIARFDRGQQPLTPFTYRLKLPVEVVAPKVLKEVV